ncbi:MAG TPA: MarR family transcriptional regulator [Anaerolineae bacterium]|nr:MarR family transcriptional regulator [Anaerolineae bacterium]
MSHPLDDYIGYRILQIHRAHRSRAEAALNQLGLHTGQEMLLFHLWNEEGLTQSQLVDQLCVEPPTVTKTLQRLEQAGLVERRQDAEDARVSRVYLTPKGRALKAQVKKIWENLEALTVQGLSEVEKALMRRLLDQINNNLAR